MGHARIFLLIALSCVWQTFSDVVDIKKFSDKITYAHVPYNYKPGETDDPIISTISFRAICTHRIDYETVEFDTDTVELGDSIFVAYHLLVPFTKHIHPLIKNPYILVTNESTANHPPHGTVSLMLDPKCAAWFSKNMILSNHPKLFQIPVGQTCYEWVNVKPHLPYLLQLASQVHDKNFIAFMRLGNTFISTRKEALTLLSKEPFIHFISSRIHPREYFDLVASSQFVIAPLGGGYDTCRFWESLMLGSIPILTHSPLDPMYEDVPCIILENWSELNMDVLIKKFDEINENLLVGKLSYAKAQFTYWKQLIADVQEKVRQDAWKGSLLTSTLLPASEIEQLKSVLNFVPPADLVIIGKGLSLRSLQYLTKFFPYGKITIVDEYLDMAALKKHTAYNPLWNQPQAKLVIYNDPNLEHTCNVIKSKNNPVHVLLDLYYYQYQFASSLEQIWKNLPKGSSIVVTNAQNSYVLDKTNAFIKKYAVKPTRKESILILKK